jgi:hypothetical protein
VRHFLDRITRSLITLVAVATALTSHATDSAPSGSVEAVWKAQRIEFVYRSEGRLYRCDTLEHKIKQVLHRLGAHEQIELRHLACHDLARQAHFELLMESPIEATPENVGDLTQYDSEDELIARVRHEQLPSSADLPRFAAVWQPISFRRDALDLDAGDCALVQQLRRQVLPKMAVHVTADIKSIDCSAELMGIAKPRLNVVALVPASEQ